MGRAVPTLALLIPLAGRLAGTPILPDDDPPTLHIGTGAGTSCATGCGGDPNSISPSVLSIYQTSGGAPDLLNPTLLIVGVPNTTGLSSAPLISLVDFWTNYRTSPTLVGSITFSLGGAGIYGWSGAGFVGNWTPSDPQVYNFVGFVPPNTNKSNNATNWFGQVPWASFFGIYVYRINGILGADGLFNVTWATPLPSGSIVIAYGCASLDPSTGRCASVGDVYTTPFTEAGYAAAAEPSSILLLGTGLGLAVRSLRRRKSTVPRP